MRIDPHTHCRDGKESYKETIEHVLKLCDEQGVDVIFDMPNTIPPILTRKNVEDRLKLVPQTAKHRYRIFIAATSSNEQLDEAIKAYNELPEVIGIKMYAGSSVGGLGVISEHEQEKIYRFLTEKEYKGVLAVHCEKEAYCTKTFDPHKPITHSQARPPEAEINAVEDQIKWAKTLGFAGHLHICHISTIEAVSMVTEAKKTMKISCAATPHHLLWSANQMLTQEGLLYKVNPPLRDITQMVALRQALKQGQIDWIETDHAPHPISEKLFSPYLSGFPSLCLYRSLVDEILPYWGFNVDQIRALTCDSIIKTFGERKIRG